MMWLKILCIVVLASGAAAKDELLNQLSGVKGRNRISICVALPMQRWRRCEGALVNREWIVARASCLSTAPIEHMTTLRASAVDSCNEVTAGHWRKTRYVRARAMHPWFNLALVIVNRPYNNLDTTFNITNIRAELQRHGVLYWMRGHFTKAAESRNTESHMILVGRQLTTYNYPIWMFCFTILTPSVLFILLFIYVTFYTGSSDEVPHKNMLYSKKVTQV